jgi:hypothetical protein
MDPSGGGSLIGKTPDFTTVAVLYDMYGSRNIYLATNASIEEGSVVLNGLEYDHGAGLYYYSCTYYNYPRTSLVFVHM